MANSSQNVQCSPLFKSSTSQITSKLHNNEVPYENGSSASEPDSPVILKKKRKLESATNSLKTPTKSSRKQISSELKTLLTSSPTSPLHRLDISGQSWAELTEEALSSAAEAEDQHQQQMIKPADSSRKRSLKVRRPDLPHAIYDTWKEPQLGWEHDEKVLARRQKDIDTGKNTAIYKQYAADVPKMARIRHVHPRTPNKYIHWPRRSWDMQVRLWRKQLYYYKELGNNHAKRDDLTSVSRARRIRKSTDDELDTSSGSSYRGSDDDFQSSEEEAMDEISEHELSELKQEEDEATLQGYIATQNDESNTLTGKDPNNLSVGPLDFSDI